MTYVTALFSQMADLTWMDFWIEVLLLSKKQVLTACPWLKKALHEAIHLDSPAMMSSDALSIMLRLFKISHSSIVLQVCLEGLDFALETRSNQLDLGQKHDRSSNTTLRCMRS